jgi:hypothetical protein
LEVAATYSGVFCDVRTKYFKRLHIIHTQTTTNINICACILFAFVIHNRLVLIRRIHVKR